MTLRELINSVDSEQYSESALYQKLRDTKPEYGTSRRIQVKLVNGEVTITNAHVGSLGDILTYQIDVAPDLQITKMQLLDEILKEHSEPQASCQIYRNPCVYRHFSVSAFSFCANFATNFRRVVFKHNFKFGNILFA